MFAPLAPGDCSVLSEGAVRRGSRSGPGTAGFVDSQQRGTV